MNLKLLKNSISGIIYPYVFETKSNTNISDWVLKNLDKFQDDINEIHSCSVNINHDRDKVLISNNEDYIELKIINAIHVKI